jgi:hypothetical protein
MKRQTKMWIVQNYARPSASYTFNTPGDKWPDKTRIASSLGIDERLINVYEMREDNDLHRAKMPYAWVLSQLFDEFGREYRHIADARWVTSKSSSILRYMGTAKHTTWWAMPTGSRNLPLVGKNENYFVISMEDCNIQSARLVSDQDLLKEIRGW